MEPVTSLQTSPYQTSPYPSLNWPFTTRSLGPNGEINSTQPHLGPTDQGKHGTSTALALQALDFYFQGRLSSKAELSKIRFSVSPAKVNTDSPVEANDESSGSIQCVGDNREDIEQVQKQVEKTKELLAIAKIQEKHSESVERVKKAFEEGKYVKDINDIWARGSRETYQNLPMEEIIQRAQKQAEAIKKTADQFERFVEMWEEAASKEPGSEEDRLFKLIKKAPPLQRILEGLGETYRIEKDEEGAYLFVGGGAPCEVHSPKGWTHLGKIMIVAEKIPSHQDPQRKVAAYLIAKEFGFRSATTVLYVNERIPNKEKEIVGYHEFRDFFDPKANPEIETWKSSHKRLIAVQKEIKAPDMTDLGKLANMFDGSKLTPEKKEKNYYKVVYPSDVERIFAQTMIFADTDQNIKNLFLIEDKKGEEYGVATDQYRAEKIDWGQAFPISNKELHLGFLGSLAEFFSLAADKSFGEETLSLIRGADVEASDLILRALGLHEAIPAMKVRVDFLKKIVEMYSNISIKEIIYRMSKIPPQAISLNVETDSCFAPLILGEAELGQIKNPAKKASPKLDGQAKDNEKKQLNLEWMKKYLETNK